jgi:hypothetical protein
LGQIVSAAEATNGVLKVMVKEKAGDKAEQVIVKIPVLGAYSKTWPLKCPKSDKIVRGFADYLAKPDSDRGFGGIGMLFLLSTGEEKDLEVVRGWVEDTVAANRSAPTDSWHLGYGGIPLAEYYLRTGDKSVLPLIQKWVDSAEEHYCSVHDDLMGSRTRKSSGQKSCDFCYTHQSTTDRALLPRRLGRSGIPTCRRRRL